MYTTQLRMCSLGAKEVAEVAEVDSCFALVRARQRYITRHWTRHKVFLPVPFTPKADPQLWASLNLSHHTHHLGSKGRWKKDLVSCSVSVYAVLTSSNKSETAVHCCHFLGTYAAHAWLSCVHLFFFSTLSFKFRCWQNLWHNQHKWSLRVYVYMVLTTDSRIRTFVAWIIEFN